MKFIRMRENEKAFTKVSTQIKKKKKLTKQRMIRPWLQIIQS